MKKLIILNGTMGVGKSAVSAELLKLLQPGVWLDGDWCWKMAPFCVSEENKRMVISNIGHLLRAFLKNSGFQYVIFCWVIPQEEIFAQLLEQVCGLEFELWKITLMCSEETLRARLEKDIQNGVRERDILERAGAYLANYREMDTIKLDTNSICAAEAARRIQKMMETKESQGQISR